MTSPLAAIIESCPYHFPDPRHVDPDGHGVVAMGADLKPATLLSAYSQGLFPWFNEGEAIAWWSPEPRCVLTPKQFVPSKSLVKQVKKSPWQMSVNRSFEQVITACRKPRSYADSTWIAESMQDAYLQLHKLGFAHSLEIWDEDGELIGGLYGLKLGALFCGESMFYRQSNASKVAFWWLNHLSIQTGVTLVDCQLPNEHLLSLGADIVTREDFLSALPSLVHTNAIDWQAFKAFMPVSELLN